MKKRFILLLLSLMIFTTNFICLAEEIYDLSFNLQEGSKYDLEMESRSSINQEIMDQSMEMGQTMNATYTYFIKDCTNQDIYKIDFTMGKMKFDFTNFKVTGSSEELDLDSLNEEMDYLNDIMADVTIEMEMDKYGDVRSINGLQEYMQDMYKHVMENSDDPEAVVAYQNMSSQFNEDMMKQSLSQYSAFIPQRAVAVGEKWTTEINLQQGFPLEMSVDYTLDSVTADEFIISFEGSLSNIGDIASMLGLGDMEFDIDMNIETDYSGIVYLDRETRWYNKMELMMNMDGYFTMKIPVDEEGNIQELKVPMSAISNILLKSN
ncbi:MAG: DUF6263 family protein [Bacillota bacterium]